MCIMLNNESFLKKKKKKSHICRAENEHYTPNDGNNYIADIDKSKHSYLNRLLNILDFA